MEKPKADRAWEKIFASTSANSGGPDAIVRFRQRSTRWPALIASAQFEREGVRRAVSELVQAAEVIPLDAAILRAAAEAEISYGLSGLDAVVLASILAHLEENRPEESCFLNLDAKDFDDPDIRDRLDAFNCRFFVKFAPALAYVLARLM